MSYIPKYMKTIVPAQKSDVICIDDVHSGIKKLFDELNDNLGLGLSSVTLRFEDGSEEIYELANP